MWQNSGVWHPGNETSEKLNIKMFCGELADYSVMKNLQQSSDKPAVYHLLGSRQQTDTVNEVWGENGGASIAAKEIQIGYFPQES